MLSGTAVVLAGGRSSRFGQDKAFVELRGRTMIERILKTVTSLFPLTLVVVKRPERYRVLDGLPCVKVVRDRFRESHALGGIWTGIDRAPTSRVFVTACDTPLLAPGLVRALWNVSEGYDACVPYYDGRLQPLAAVYSRKCLTPISRMIRKKHLRIRDLFWEVRTRVAIEETRKADPRGLSFMDIDTPADLAAISRLRCGGGNRR